MLAYSTSSHAVRVTDRIARVAAAGRVTAERRARMARATRERAAGQHLAEGPWDCDWCFICGRPTDHTGEH